MTKVFAGDSKQDLVIVGGGLAGLAAAVAAARAGLQVALLEKTGESGGRAQTQQRDGFFFNLGPHALYRGLAGMRILRSFGIEPRGGRPSVAGALAIQGGAKHELPGGPLSLLRTSLFGIGAKLEVAALLSRLPRLDASKFDGISVDDALPQLAGRDEVRALLRALLRLSTYVHAPAEQCAGQALTQLQSALTENVLYLDGGWATLVSALHEKAAAAGVRLMTHAPASQVLISDQTVRGVKLRDGQEMRADAVLLAMGPTEASSLVGDGAHRELAGWAREAAPVRAACLDLALDELPVPSANFALGIDQPCYFSIHSASAALAPESGALVQVARYLAPGETGDANLERELEALCDLVQPGWRAHVHHRRYLPRLTVCHDLVAARRNGLAGRPDASVPDLAGLYIAGDWVGHEGILADASLASGVAAARLAADKMPPPHATVN